MVFVTIAASQYCSSTHTHTHTHIHTLACGYKLIDGDDMEADTVSYIESGVAVDVSLFEGQVEHLAALFVAYLSCHRLVAGLRERGEGELG